MILASHGVSCLVGAQQDCGAILPHPVERFNGFDDAQLKNYAYSVVQLLRPGGHVDVNSIPKRRIDVLKMLLRHDKELTREKIEKVIHTLPRTGTIFPPPSPVSITARLLLAHSRG